VCLLPRTQVLFTLIPNRAFAGISFPDEKIEFLTCRCQKTARSLVPPSEYAPRLLIKGEKP